MPIWKVRCVEVESRKVRFEVEVVAGEEEIEGMALNWMPSGPYQMEIWKVKVEVEE